MCDVIATMLKTKIILIAVAICIFCTGATEDATPCKRFTASGMEKSVTKWDNLLLGTPCKSDQILCREGFAVGYSMKYKQPLWVAYRLTKEEVLTRKAS